MDYRWEVQREQRGRQTACHRERDVILVVQTMQVDSEAVRVGLSQIASLSEKEFDSRRAGNSLPVFLKTERGKEANDD